MKRLALIAALGWWGVERVQLYGQDDPASDAFTFLTIDDSRDRERVFQGWMVASSPALNALDHPRYDVWALSCE